MFAIRRIAVLSAFPIYRFAQAVTQLFKEDAAVAFDPAQIVYTVEADGRWVESRALTSLDAISNFIRFQSTPTLQMITIVSKMAEITRCTESNEFFAENMTLKTKVGCLFA